MMNIEDKNRFKSEFDELCRRYNLGFDDALEVFAQSIETDADRVADSSNLVKSLLYGAAHDLRNAAFNIYASYK